MIRMAINESQLRGEMTGISHSNEYSSNASVAPIPILCFYHISVIQNFGPHTIKVIIYVYGVSGAIMALTWKYCSTMYVCLTFLISRNCYKCTTSLSYPKTCYLLLESLCRVLCPSNFGWLERGWCITYRDIQYWYDLYDLANWGSYFS